MKAGSSLFMDSWGGVALPSTLEDSWESREAISLLEKGSLESEMPPC